METFCYVRPASSICRACSHGGCACSRCGGTRAGPDRQYRGRAAEHRHDADGQCRAIAGDARSHHRRHRLDVRLSRFAQGGLCRARCRHRVWRVRDRLDPDGRHLRRGRNDERTRAPDRGHAVSRMHAACDDRGRNHGGDGHQCHGILHPVPDGRIDRLRADRLADPPDLPRDLPTRSQPVSPARRLARNTRPRAQRRLLGRIVADALAPRATLQHSRDRSWLTRPA
ncbi:hypothetical protein BOS5A_180042 [Bosea sp. EC-HK365B]|nr:hypothetical protein BOS5A_180042 [Bosea sp. EC-HK365B]